MTSPPTLADAPAQPCGGTAIAAVSLSSCSEFVLIRFGGQFYLLPSQLVIPYSCNDAAGFRLPRVTQDTPPPLEIYTPSTGTWSTIYPPPIRNTASQEPAQYTV
ncbi:hypothetical protein EV363DRAFT_1259829 [Boletus edulis]|nr:hypothetical protein EV363DRAFT_1259829 [Boletus edulis]